MALTAEVIEGFTRAFLLAGYDEPVEIPEFHKAMWRDCCSEETYVALAAPRGFAKSTAITHAYGLASALFRESKYIIIISDTESQASMFLDAIKQELQHNEKLKEVFGIRQLTKDAVTDIICEMQDGYKFKIMAFGSEQKVRGRKWGGFRPDLLLGDDLESDEMVENDERRNKLKERVLKATIPAMSRSGKIRIVGTILHLDSLLYSLIKNKEWKSRLYKGHKSYGDFSDLLWPELWPEKRLRKLQRMYEEAGYPEGYSQEILNNPADQSETYFKPEDFLPMKKEDNHFKSYKEYYAGLDLAISDRDKRAYTAMVIGGVDADGIIHIVHITRDRFSGDSMKIIDEILDLQKKYNCGFWKCERGQISMTISAPLKQEALKRGINIWLDDDDAPVKDKRGRARAIQSLMRQGAVRFNKEASWYELFEEELLHFPKGIYKDQVDAIAWLGTSINELNPGPTDEEYEEEKYDKEFGSVRVGMCIDTGY